MNKILVEWPGSSEGRWNRKRLTPKRSRNGQLTWKMYGPWEHMKRFVVSGQLILCTADRYSVQAEPSTHKSRGEQIREHDGDLRDFYYKKVKAKWFEVGRIEHYMNGSIYFLGSPEQVSSYKAAGR